MIEIVKINALDSSEYEQVKEIFYQTSSAQNFKDKIEKENFEYKYFGYYRLNYPNLFLVLKSDDQIMGYICGSKNSLEDFDLFKNLSHFELFKDLYAQYPIHLHINMHPDSQGKGLGSTLLKAFEALFTNGSGIHLLTAPSAQNRSFYRKNGYLSESERKFNKNSILFMGKLI